jgi:YbgC/YbaW family acyl-CoA thioester hydrolase
MKNYTNPVHIRFFDIDLNQHVNNAVYFTYMENARTELFMDDFIEYLNRGITFVVAEAFCKYRRPIRLQDKVICELQLDLTGSLHLPLHICLKMLKPAYYMLKGPPSSSCLMSRPIDRSLFRRILSINTFSDETTIYDNDAA